MIVDCKSFNLPPIGKMVDESFDGLNTTHSHLARRMIARVASTMLIIASDHNLAWIREYRRDSLVQCDDNEVSQVSSAI